MKPMKRSYLPNSLSGLLALVGIVGAISSARASNYIVDASNASAADTNPGTAAQPFKTISAAVAKAQAGDVVEVHAGIYRGEKIDFKQSGTKDQPIVLRAAVGSEVTIKGSQVVAGWQADSKTPGAYEHDGWDKYFGKWDSALLDTLTVGKPIPLSKYGAPVYDARNKPRNQLFVDDAPVEEVAARDLLRAGSFFIDPTSHAVLLWLADGSDPGKHTIEMADTEGPLLTTDGQSFITIQGLSFEQGANGPQDNGLVRLAGGSNCLADHCRVSLAAGAGFTFSGESHIVRQGVFNHNGQEGLHSSKAVNSRVEQCETSFNNTLPGKEYGSGWEAGGNKFARSRNLTIDGLVTHDNHGPGVWFDVDNEDCTIENCISYNNDFGIFYEISYTALVINNRAYNNKDTGIYISSSAGCRVYNNTTYGNGKSGISIETSVREDGTGRKSSGYSNRIFNNIIAENQTTPYSKSFNLGLIGKTGKDLPALTGSKLPMEPNVSDYNLFYIAKEEPFFIGPGSARPKNLKEWQTASGQDAHSVWAAPGFLNAVGADFGLTASSPAVGTGTALKEVTADAIGTPRPPGAPCDIGALQTKR
jgi:parallel beta-helix repeat protein